MIIYEKKITVKRTLLTKMFSFDKTNKVINNNINQNIILKK